MDPCVFKIPVSMNYSMTSLCYPKCDLSVASAEIWNFGICKLTFGIFSCTNSVLEMSSDVLRLKF